jgi:N-acetylglucosaminyl-diphospho-decaprenol L-rhamnosyltransferase
VTDGAGLDVSIVSYRCEGLLRDCLQSLRDNPPSRGMTVHVVDNASGDGTAEMVARDFPEYRLTASEQNLGFSAANNIAIRAGSAPYVLILNPDTRITSESLDHLMELMDSRPEVGMTGPRLELEDGSFDHAAKRSFPTPLSALAHFTGVGRRRDSGTLAAYRAPEVESGPVDAVNGAFMLARRAALDQVGLFDEGFWMYMEDLDLCYRLAQAGWVTWYEPDVTVIHLKAGTTGKERSFRLNRAFHYGMYRFYRKHYAVDHNPLFNLTIYSGILAKLTVTVVKSELRRFRRSLDRRRAVAGEAA